MNRTNFQILLILAFAVVSTACALGQTSPSETRQNERLEKLERKLTDVERKATGGATFLFGVFCALWAQNTNRSAWLWFFLGLFFSVITVIVLLVKNSNDLLDRRQRELFKHDLLNPDI